MRKIEFDIKFRPQIESGEYKVITRDDRPVRIVCWDMKSDHYPILALIDDGTKELHKSFTTKGRYFVEGDENSQDLFIIIPEEEDERIRKELISFVYRHIECHDKPDAERDEKYESWIAWLEKQGEQKPADKVEPKFHEGDWVCENEPNNYARFIQILEIVNVQGKERYRISRDLHNDEDIVECRFIENNYHLFNIQDAKEGDVLEFGDHGRLVVGIVSYVNKTTGKVDVNCLLENNNFKVGNYYNLDTIKPHPATKEQSDLLFQKMHEAGYEWDANKKELKKIEQPKQEWSEEDEKNV